MATEPVAARLDEEEQQLLERFAESEGYDKPADAVRNALVFGLERWQRENDPAYSWLLNIGIAATLWSMLAVIGHIRIGTPPWDIAAFSVVMAFIFLTAHAVQLLRQRWAFGISAPQGVDQ